MPEVKQKYRKPKMICPFCQARKADGNFRAFSINGMTMHVRQIHPEHDNEYQAHRPEYMERFACDVDGVLAVPDSKPEPTQPPEAVIVEEPISEPVYVELDDTPPAATPTATPAPKPPATPIDEPVNPKKEEFRHEPDPKGYEYNPYASGY